MDVVRHWGWLLGAGVLGCWGLAGCQTVPLVEKAPLVKADPAPGKVAAKGERELPPRESAQLCLTAGVEMEEAGSVENAAIYYERARQLDPRLAGQVGRRLAVLYDRQGNWALALEEYQEALKRTPGDPDLLNDVGYGYYCRGKWAEAETYLRKAVEADPDHPRAWINLGMVLTCQGKHQEGLEAFAKALPEDAALCNLGFVLAARGNHKEARRAYAQAVALNPDLLIARVALEKLGKTPPRPGEKGDIQPVGGTADPGPQDPKGAKKDSPPREGLPGEGKGVNKHCDYFPADE